MKQLERKTYLAETEEEDKDPRELEAMSEEERKNFQERMSERISQWLQMYLESNPEKGSCKVYNIGNSSPVQLMDFIHTIEKVTGRQAIKEFVPMQQGDVYTTYADTSKLERDFGFKPGTPLEKGIREFYKWYCKFYEIPE